MLFITAITTFSAGCVQALSGFGAGIIMMMIFPYLLSMQEAAALSGILGLPLAVSIAYRYRKKICLKQVILPAVIFLITSGISITVSSLIDLDRFKIIFGFLLILLSIFFAFFSERIHVHQNVLTVFICSSLSGIMGGFFWIGGPLLVIYFLAVTKNTEAYLGSVNFVFASCEIYNGMLRICTGILTTSLLPNILIGCIFILLGRIVGSRLSERMNGIMIKKIIYAMLALSGIITIIQSF